MVPTAEQIEAERRRPPARDVIRKHDQTGHRPAIPIEQSIVVDEDPLGMTGVWGGGVFASPGARGDDGRGVGDISRHPGQAHGSRLRRVRGQAPREGPMAMTGVVRRWVPGLHFAPPGMTGLGRQALCRMAEVHLAKQNGMDRRVKTPCVYILATGWNGTLYVGVTNDVVRRVWEHKNGAVEGFTKTYGVHTLVYYELYDTMLEAIVREKRLKKWKRAWKIELIEQSNPRWMDLYGNICR